MDYFILISYMPKSVFEKSLWGRYYLQVICPCFRVPRGWYVYAGYAVPMGLGRG
ncbi:Uncharacterized protein dnm_085050 [Desulfonema magnum]|uniref:Uncharacterized protein n=1 Tax=Desulfonema magnum TaxID=45655 RepID=A0A975BWH8_9BACT|nr:Uncharacterized protein dnm_085050 [Desulfonema magnum]